MTNFVTTIQRDLTGLSRKVLTRANGPVLKKALPYKPVCEVLVLIGEKLRLQCVTDCSRLTRAVTAFRYKLW